VDDVFPDVVLEILFAVSIIGGPK